MPIGGSTVVEHLAHYLKIKGSNPAASTILEKMAKNLVFNVINLWTCYYSDYCFSYSITTFTVVY
jgi:hypothetical protein